MSRSSDTSSEAILVVFALQAWACRAWLERFRFGPLEWAWRSLTWLQVEPFRAKTAGPG